MKRFFRLDGWPAAIVGALVIGIILALAVNGCSGSSSKPAPTPPPKRAAVAPTLPLVFACFNSANQIESTRVGYGVKPTCAHSVPPDKIISWQSVAPPTTSSTTTTTVPPTTTTSSTTTSTTTTSTTRPPTTTSTTTTTTQPPPAGLTFDDEFDGTTLSSLWTPGWFRQSGPVNPAEIACYQPSQIAVGGGYLHLTAIASSSACPGRSYVTGQVETRYTFQFTTGTMEVRAFLPGDAGGVYNWPAIWTDGLGTWPQTGESDVMEGLSGHATCTYHSPQGGQSCNAGGKYGWHTYGETVIPGRVQYFYDGALVGSITNNTVGFHPHEVILANQMGQYGGLVVAPTEMLIDYVRVRKDS